MSPNRQDRRNPPPCFPIEGYLSVANSVPPFLVPRSFSVAPLPFFILLFFFLPGCHFTFFSFHCLAGDTTHLRVHPFPRQMTSQSTFLMSSPTRSLPVPSLLLLFPLLSLPL